MNETIKQKILLFTHKQISFKLQIAYDYSKFGDGEKSWWQTRLYKIDDKFITPIFYTYIEKANLLNQDERFREHRFFCSTRRKPIFNSTNIYPLAKQQIISEYFK